MSNHDLMANFMVTTCGWICDKVDATSRNGTKPFEVSLGEVQPFAREAVYCFGAVGSRMVKKGIQ